MADATPELGVLIVGAGPTGLALAVQLDAMGITPRIIDRQPDRVRESRALALQPRTLEVLDSVELAPALLARGRTAVGVRLHAGHRTTLLPLGGAGVDDTAFPSLLFLSQAEVEQQLVEHLARRGVEVERRTELRSLQPVDDAVICVLVHHDGVEERIRTRYVAGCDGAHSAVRRLTAIPFEGARYPQSFVLADVAVDGGLERDEAHMFVGGAGALFFFPLGEPAPWRIIGMSPGGTVPQAAQAPSLADVQAVTDAFTGGALRLRDPAWLSRFQVQHRQARHYRAGRVFLAGDAAHVHSPAGAQGMNTGIQDSWNLGWKLVLTLQGTADRAILDSYEQERWPVGRSVLWMSDRPFRIGTSQAPLARAARALALPMLAPLMARWRMIAELGFRAIAELDIGYHDSAIVKEGEPRLHRGPKAGDRLPDVRVKRNGRDCWLHEALRPLGFHLLLLGPDSLWSDGQLAAVRDRYHELLTLHDVRRVATPDVLHDAHGEAFEQLGVQDVAQYLVRPDGHVAFRSGGADLAGLQRYLEVLLPGARSAPG